MGRVKTLLTNLYQILEETFNSPEDIDFNSKEDSFTPDPPISPLTEEDCFNFNLTTKDFNLDLIEKIDYKTYLLLLMAGYVNVPEKGKVAFSDLFVDEPLLMEFWLHHVLYKSNFKNFYSLIANKTYFLSIDKELKESTGQDKPKQKKIKCLHDLPLQKKLSN